MGPEAGKIQMHFEELLKSNTALFVVRAINPFNLVSLQIKVCVSNFNRSCKEFKKTNFFSCYFFTFLFKKG